MITTSTQVKQQFVRLRTCVLMPTYNNVSTLEKVLLSVLEYCDHVFVVNDGSTDGSLQVLQSYPQIHLITYSQNRGKGHALKVGLRAASAAGFHYAITIDSDGQHFADDLTVFLHALEKFHRVKEITWSLNRSKDKQVLMIGSRNLNQENVPTKSSFGNRFSSFWYWINTGIRLPDTQSGYRLYPLILLPKKKFFTSKFEFEIEIIVRAAWYGIPVIQVPVGVHYPPKEERISHFRPFKDFTRISLLNTILVLAAFFYFHPRNFYRRISTKGGLKSMAKSIFQNPQESNQVKAASLGFGVFMGIVPIWGFQLAVGIPLAIFFRLNKALFILAANISIFPLTAFWLVSSLAVGKWLMGNNKWSKTFHDFSASQLVKDGTAFLLGGVVLAVSLGLMVYFLSLLILKCFRKQG